MINRKQNNFDKLPDEQLEQKLKDLRAKLNSRLSRRQKKQCKGSIEAINKVLDARRKIENVVPIRSPEQVQVNADSDKKQGIDIGENLNLDKKIQIERIGEEEYIITQIYYGETLSMNSSSLEDAIENAEFLGADPDEIERVINEVKEAI